MRDILFRGKRLDNGEWVYGDLVHSQYKIGDTCVGQYGNTVGIHQVNPETVGQYTGLTDRNGTKIFEGDIVDILTENEEIGVVDYEDGGFLVNADGFSVDFHANIYGTDLEVIGNIHDHHMFRLEEAK